MSAKIIGIITFSCWFVWITRPFTDSSWQSQQEDQIADAITKIAGGDTSYQMNLAYLGGKGTERVGNMDQQHRNRTGACPSEQVRAKRLKADLITNVSYDITSRSLGIINYVDLLKRNRFRGTRPGILKSPGSEIPAFKNLTEDLVEAQGKLRNVKLEMTTLDIVEMIWQTNEFEEKICYPARSWCPHCRKAAFSSRQMALPLVSPRKCLQQRVKYAMEHTSGLH